MFAERTRWDLDPNRLSQALERIKSAGGPVLDLTTSNPTACGFTHDSESILRALANPAVLRYDPDPRGLPVARRAVAGYYAERGVDISPEAVVLATGTSEAYAHAMRLLCDPGDEILVPQPSYPLLTFIASIQDVSLVPYSLLYKGRWKIDFSSIEKAITPRTRAVVVIHPNNPTGNYCQLDEMLRLEGLCAESELAMIADEVFLDFALDGPAPSSFAGCSRTLAFVLSGLSKIAGLPQMKAAWMAVCGAEPLRHSALDRLEVIADTFLSMNAPIQLAMPAFLGLQRDFRQQLLARVRQNLAELDRRLAGRTWCRRLPVEGGWYVVLRVETDRTDEDLAIELLTTQGVYIHPGHFYDFPAEGYLVASLICPPSEFAEGIGRLLTLR